MTTVDFQKQPVLRLEMIGHAAGICAGCLRNVPHRHGIEAIGRKQLFRGTQDRLAQTRLARRNLIAIGLRGHLQLDKCTKQPVTSTNIWRSPWDDVRARSQAPSRLFRLAEGALLRSW